MQDATPNLAQTLEQLITNALTAELDRVMFIGAAANQEPAGLVNTAGINTLPMGAAALELRAVPESSRAHVDLYPAATHLARNALLYGKAYPSACC